MSENNNDKFWETNDDFWSKPVASDDWLKSDTNSYETNVDDTKEIKVKTNLWEETVNPYLNRDSHYNTYETNQVQQPVTATVLNGQVLDKPKKKVHVHTIICLIFIALAVLSVVGSYARYFMAKKTAIHTANQVNYTETKMDYTFTYDSNNEISFAEEAISYVSENNFTGFPQNMKLIGIYLEVDSTEYIRGANVLQDIYLGYVLEDKPYYQKLPRQDIIYPYVSSKGFHREEILGNYGLGNGVDDEGYLFFFVPSQIEDVTLYMPKTVKENYIDVIETVYYVSFPIAEDEKEADE